MKDNKPIKKIVVYSLAMLLLLMCFIGGKTFSKYVMQIQGRGIIDVAKWNFLVNGQSSQMTNISLAQTCTPSTLKENCIAPGTQGSFQIVINAEGCQTGVDYTVKFENELGKPTNLKFIYEDGLYNSLKELESQLRGQIAADQEEKIKTYMISWLWNYETGTTPEEIKQNDEIDTQEAKHIQNYTFDVVVTGIQQKPKTV
ncbi:MAG: hypothetical protein ACLU84_06195 [Clostridia bacterium]